MNSSTKNTLIYTTYKGREKHKSYRELFYVQAGIQYLLQLRW